MQSSPCLLLTTVAPPEPIEVPRTRPSPAIEVPPIPLVDRAGSVSGWWGQAGWVLSWAAPCGLPVTPW